MSSGHIRTSIKSGLIRLQTKIAQGVPDLPIFAVQITNEQKAIELNEFKGNLGGLILYVERAEALIERKLVEWSVFVAEEADIQTFMMGDPTANPPTVGYMASKEDMEVFILAVQHRQRQVDVQISILGVCPVQPGPGNPNPPQNVPVRLPELTLQSFNGKLVEWLGFWSNFESMVHCRPVTELTRAQKFSYLRGVLSGEALSFINGLTPTDANYDIAIDVLHKQYGRPDQLKAMFIREFRSIPVSSNKTEVLKRTLIRQQVLLRQLESLGDTVFSSEPTFIREKYPLCFVQEACHYVPVGRQLEQLNAKELVDVFMNTLTKRETYASWSDVGMIKDSFGCPRDNHAPQGPQEGGLAREQKSDQQWKSARGYTAPISSMNSFFIGVKGTDQRARRVNNWRPKEARPSFHSRSSHWRPKEVCQSAQFNGKKTTAKVCIFCNGLHCTESCPTVITPNKRWSIIRRKQLCYRCFQMGHFASNCPRIQLCGTCNGSHNIALCKSRRAEQINQSPSNQSTVNQSSTVKQSTVNQARINTVQQTQTVPRQECTINSVQKEKTVIKKSALLMGNKSIGLQVETEQLGQSFFHSVQSFQLLYCCFSILLPLKIFIQNISHWEWKEDRIFKRHSNYQWWQCIWRLLLAIGLAVGGPQTIKIVILILLFSCLSPGNRQANKEEVINNRDTNG